MTEFHKDLVALSTKLQMMSNVARNAGTEEVSNYRIGVTVGRADALMEAANLVLDMALKVQAVEAKGE